MMVGTSSSNWLQRQLRRMHATQVTQPKLAQVVLPQQAPAARPHPPVLTRKERKYFADLTAVAETAVSEVEGGRRAERLALHYQTADAEERLSILRLIAERFSPDSAAIKQAKQRYESSIGTVDEAEAEINLRRVLYSHRIRLLQRFNSFPDGMRFLLQLRVELLGLLKQHRTLKPLDADLEQLFASWFDIGFLELRRITWDSPASLLEKLIRYEAVHDIEGWSDLKNRLDADRRCYGYFHPRVPDEPLIFIEVALTEGLAENVQSLLDENAPLGDVRRANTAVFYSISNTQPGLKGVGFGDSLIKRVAETLQLELPRIKVFATLSPIPGLRAWLRQCDAELDNALESRAPNDLDDQARKAVLRYTAEYLTGLQQDAKPADLVARFHLGNGARVEQLNWAADLSSKGLRQSYGLMVNYLYDLKRLDKYRADLAKGRVARSTKIDALM
jgi:malonyl-CoA decarboxylase